MKSLYTYIDEAMKAYEMDKKHPRQMGGKYMKTEKNGMTAVFLVFEQPSETYGIDGGRISKLEIRDNNKKFLANYDRGWDIQPENTEAKKFLDEILKKFN